MKNNIKTATSMPFNSRDDLAAICEAAWEQVPEQDPQGGGSRSFSLLGEFAPLLDGKKVLIEDEALVLIQLSRVGEDAPEAHWYLPAMVFPRMVGCTAVFWEDAPFRTKQEAGLTMLEDLACDELRYVRRSPGEHVLAGRALWLEGQTYFVDETHRVVRDDFFG